MYRSNMYSETYQKLKQEIREKTGKDTYSKNHMILIETQIFKELPQKCTKCDRTENLTLDHIVPRYTLQMFGFDIEHSIIENNYQVLCRPCNAFKSNRLDFTRPETKKILMELLEKL